MEFRRSLTLSFLFRFNLEVLQKLRQTVGDDTDRCVAERCSHQSLTKTSCSQNVVTDSLPEKMPIQPLPREIHPSLQGFQVPTHLSSPCFLSDTQTDCFIFSLSVCQRTRATRTQWGVPSCIALPSARPPARPCTVTTSPGRTGSSFWFWSPALEHTLRSREHKGNSLFLVGGL